MTGSKTYSDLITIEPARRLRGIVEVPGDKSISHRALLLAGIARGVSRIRNLSTSADVASTLGCLRSLGVEIVRNRTEALIRGAKGRLAEPANALDAGNSGTTMRLLSGILAGQPFRSLIDGDRSVRQRPMRRIIVPLTEMGARISAREDQYAPLRITGRFPLKAIDYSLPVASAQVKSCVLLAGLFASGTTSVREPSQTRDHTERMLPHFGVRVEKSVDGVVRLSGPATPGPNDVAIPGDPSSAAFLWAAAALIPGSEVTVQNVSTNPTRIAFLRVLQRMGASIEIDNVRQVSFEPLGDVTASDSGRLEAVNVGAKDVPPLIDELPLIAVLAAFASGTSAIRGAQELRVKESDRIRAMASNLRAMGAEVEELPDGWVIEGVSHLNGATVEACGDHRIAMATAVAALAARGSTTILGSDCVSISFPNFFETINALKA